VSASNVSSYKPSLNSILFTLTENRACQAWQQETYPATSSQIGSILLFHPRTRIHSPAFRLWDWGKREDKESNIYILLTDPSHRVKGVRPSSQSSRGTEHCIACQLLNFPPSPRKGIVLSHSIPLTRPLAIRYYHK
jgi:hypothetical protein